jgi:branched-chain amino acid transport system substrate-binding protein
MNAFQSVDEVAPTPVRNAIRDADPFSTVYGEVNFDDSGVINKNMLVYQWQPDPGLQIVYPENVAQSDPVYPTPAWSER